MTLSEAPIVPLTQVVFFLWVALASFAISHVIVSEEGPSRPWKNDERGIFFRFRFWVGVYDRGENGQPKTNAGRLWSCGICAGFYIHAFLHFFMHVVHWHFIHGLVDFFAGYGLLIVLVKVVSRR